MNIMKDAIEANWETSMYELNETKSLVEIERNEHDKLKLAYSDLVHLKNSIESKGLSNYHYH